MRTIVLDRDGVLNLNSSDSQSPLYYVLKKEDLQLKPGVKEAVAKLKGRKVILATRQKCISKGLATIFEINAINEHLEALLDFKFDEIYVQPDGDNKRLAFQTIVEKYGKCVLVDDKWQECEAGARCGMVAICTDDLPSVIDQVLQA